MRAASLGVVAALAVFAGEFWEREEPGRWSNEQIQELLSASPWARPAEVRFLGERGGSTIPGVGLPGGRGRGGGSPLPGGGGWPGAGGGIGFPWVGQARDSDLDETTVVWTSALPVRQALELLGLTDELRNVHARDFYVATLDGLPLPLAPLAETPETFRRAARLELKSGTQIRAERVEVRPRPGAPAVELYFPRDPAVSPGDKTIELQVTAGEYSIRRKFKLSEMLYRGRLEL